MWSLPEGRRLLDSSTNSGVIMKYYDVDNYRLNSTLLKETPFLTLIVKGSRSAPQYVRKF
jgi:hypothetical protein